MNLARILELAWPHRWRLAFCGMLMVAESLSLLAVPWLAGMFASGIGSPSQFSIGQISLGILALLGAQALLRIIHGVILARTSSQILAKLRRSLYDHLQALPIGFFHARRQGDLLALLTFEIQQLSSFISGTVLSLFPTALILIGALVMMLRIDAFLAVPVALGVPAFFLMMKIMGRRLRPLAGDFRAAYASSMAVAEENFSMLPAIKSFTQEPRESDRHGRHIDQVRDLGIEMAQINASLGPVVQFIAAAAVVLVLWLAGDRVTAGDMSQGELVAFLLYGALLTRPVSGLADFWGETQHARGTLARLDEILRVSPEPATGGLDPEPVSGTIQFEDVCFSHTERSPALHDLSLRIAAGETVALTGPNGAGKSTLVDLLLRFYTPDSGEIRLDGVNIASLNLRKLRQAIALVPQNVLLFDDTVAENIRYGTPDAGNEAVIEAARKAQALQFVTALPQGFDTLIGERGVRLSGGERQRIALARALLKNPAILVLDEPTAMFDPEGEHRFVEEARDALAGRTVILITHRPASLSMADRVVVLKGGRIVAECSNETQMVNPRWLASHPDPAAK